MCGFYVYDTLRVLPCNWGLFTFHVPEAKLGKAGEAEAILIPQLDGGASLKVDLPSSLTGD